MMRACEQLLNAEEYLKKHQVQAKVEAAVNELLKTMPDNAIESIAGPLLLHIPKP